MLSPFAAALGCSPTRVGVPLEDCGPYWNQAVIDHRLEWSPLTLPAQARRIGGLGLRELRIRDQHKQPIELVTVLDTGRWTLPCGGLNARYYDGAFTGLQAVMQPQKLPGDQAITLVQQLYEAEQPVLRWNLAEIEQILRGPLGEPVRPVTTVGAVEINDSLSLFGRGDKRATLYRSPTIRQRPDGAPG